MPYFAPENKKGFLPEAARWKPARRKPPQDTRGTKNPLRKKRNKNGQNQRTKREHPARYLAYHPLFLCGVLHRPVPVLPENLVQPPDYRDPVGNALRQQLAQPAARNLGPRHQILFQTNTPSRHHPLRFPAHAPEYRGSRRNGHPDRHHHCNCNHPVRLSARQTSENGQGNGLADLGRQRDLRSRCGTRGGCHPQTKSL